MILSQIELAYQIILEKQMKTKTVTVTTSKEPVKPTKANVQDI
jgi:hypothetical protein